MVWVSNSTYMLIYRYDGWTQERLDLKSELSVACFLIQIQIIGFGQYATIIQSSST